MFPFIEALVEYSGNISAPSGRLETLFLLKLILAPVSQRKSSVLTTVASTLNSNPEFSMSPALIFIIFPGTPKDGAVDLLIIISLVSFLKYSADTKTLLFHKPKSKPIFILLVDSQTKLLLPNWVYPYPVSSPYLFKP